MLSKLRSFFSSPYFNFAWGVLYAILMWSYLFLIIAGFSQGDYHRWWWILYVAAFFFNAFVRLVWQPRR